MIEALDLKDLRVVGHSSGGLATLMAAAQLPGRIVQACLAETRVGESPANAPPGELRIRANRTRMKREAWGSREAMYQAYRGRTVFKDWDEVAFQSYIEGGTRLLPDGRAQLKCLPEVEATFYEQRESLKVSRYLDELRGQFLLLLGSYPEAQTLQDVGVRRFTKMVKGATVKPMGIGVPFPCPWNIPKKSCEKSGLSSKGSEELPTDNQSAHSGDRDGFGPLNGLKVLDLSIIVAGRHSKQPARRLWRRGGQG